MQRDLQGVRGYLQGGEFDGYSSRKSDPSKARDAEFKRLCYAVPCPENVDGFGDAEGRIQRPCEREKVRGAVCERGVQGLFEHRDADVHAGPGAENSGRDRLEKGREQQRDFGGKAADDDREEKGALPEWGG